MNKIKDANHFRELCDYCKSIEPKLKQVIEQFGYPPFWHREPNFANLILTILEQQVSLASAKAAYNKLVEKIAKLTPENLLKLTDDDLKACYFSRQKIIYTRVLALEIVKNRLDLEKLNSQTDLEIRSRLIQLKGIGNWTVDIYLLMNLHFSDIFPPGDLATIKSVYELKLVSPESSKEDIVEYMKKFSPYQTAATYILWHNYIQKRNLKL
ncbi:MAG: DNA-3-methyladenine glycosylase 2 family protein [Prolixibacteraceae bacterium]|jgi:DNA-3-methyladenine glycosylase II|nr:DNA-3-methyladenine glycosylase 2 family protein [Prolixibacteraceae bacterium]MBT6005249.1 DNA-3-methyladenine glycosylase 2 family protein [Prolixibacteraceae bacterium]MBT6763767.1 DNA-3-methyladenine glycosylase 2 family protein [Prolixibacteraceae bacterium]MBT6996863.1 DNA-3-methyladenine glycosylase 2 family protein [Prolixibacteraceae bacterium]MBT7395462.1 DNA-3-methyladenine glycosylase 2 family protein [Prolixibacteraceae bacterium]